MGCYTMRNKPSRTRSAPPRPTPELRHHRANFRPGPDETATRVPAGLARTYRRPRGFTLPELLVVIAIVLVLVGLLVPIVGRFRKQAQATTTMAAIRDIGLLMHAYHDDFK